MLPIVWSEKAKRNYADIIDELSGKSVDAAIKLEEQIDKLMNLISVYPNACQATKKEKNVRRGVVGRNYSVVYEVKVKFLYVKSIKHNRKRR